MADIVDAGDAAAYKGRAPEVQIAIEETTLPLHTAAKQGNKAEVAKLLSEGKKVDEADKRGNTALHYAVQNGHKDVAKQLSKEGAPLTCLNKDSMMPVSKDWGTDEIRKALLTYGPHKMRVDNVGEQDVLGRTILHYAAELGNSYVMRKLLRKPKAGDCLKKLDKDSKTPLDLAQQNKPVEQILRSIKLPTEIRNHEDDHQSGAASEKTSFPLHEAAMEGKKAATIKLLGEGAYVDEADKRGNTALHYAVMNGHEVVAKQLAKEGASLTCVNNDSMMPVSKDWGGDEIRKALLTYGPRKMNATVGVKDAFGRSILHYAAELGNSYVTRKLLNSSGVPGLIEEPDFDNKTPLDYAAGHDHVIEKILRSKLAHPQDAGAARLMTSTSDELDGREGPRATTERQGNIEKAESLTRLWRLATGIINGRSDVGKLPNFKTLLDTDHKDLVKKTLSEAGLDDLFQRDNEENTILHRLVAVKSTATLDNASILKDLLSAYDPSELPVNEGDKEEKTPLHLYAGKGMDEQVKILLDHGADCNKVDNNRWWPIHYAAKSGNLDVLEAFLPKYRDVNSCKTTEGRSGLHIAAEQGHKSAVEWFLENGARVDELDKTKNTSLHLAVANKKADVVELLVNEGADIGAWNDDEAMPLTYAEGDLLRVIMNESARALPQHVKQKDDFGKSVLHYAAEGGCQNLVEQLVDMQNVDIAQCDKSGNNPLHLAAKAGNLEAAQIVLKKVSKDKDKEHKLFDANKEGRTPFVCALLGKHNETLLNIVVRPPNKLSTALSTALFTYVQEYKPQRQEALDFLIKNVDVSSLVDRDHGKTFRHWAVVHKNVDVVEGLGKTGVPLKPDVEDKEGMTAMHYCMEQKCWHMRDALLEHIKDMKGEDESLHIERQLYMDAINACLVGAALIASLPFGGLAQLAPSNTDISSNLDRIFVKVFWVFNSMSFFFAMATIISSILGIFPMRRPYIGIMLKEAKFAFRVVATLLLWSVGLVLCAFTCVSLLVLHQLFRHHKWAMSISTMSVGWFICVFILVACPLQHKHLLKVQRKKEDKGQTDSPLEK